MRSRERRGCGGGLILCALGIFLGVAFGVVLPYPARTWLAGRLPAGLSRLAQPPPSPTPAPTPPPTPTPTPTPAPTPTPTPLPAQLTIPPKTREVTRMYNGAQVHTSFDAQPGRQAVLERETPASYALDLQFQVKIPTASRTAEELARSAPTLAAVLPKLPALLEKAEISKFYFGLYQNKTEVLRQNLLRLDAMLSRDTFYDTDTILEIQDPDTKRRVLLIQADMDVDSDGSDPDRLNEVDASDPTFQPLTSYKWPKRTPTPSILLNPYRERLARWEAEAKAVPPRRSAASLETLRNEVYQIDHYSSLIARTDPFIVLPGFMVRQTGHVYQPRLGDYAVVIVGDRVYPAIFGDIGPSDRAGEASLRLAQAVDPRATAQRSPVNELKITYLVFPGTAEPPYGPPDLGKIRAKCQALLNEIGGCKVELKEWANLIPTPTPVLTPTPVPSVTPAASLKPGISPLPTPATAAKPGASVSLTPAPVLKPVPSPLISPVPAPSASVAVPKSP